MISLLNAGFSAEKVHATFVNDKLLLEQANANCDELGYKVSKLDLLTVNDVKNLAKAALVGNGKKKESDYDATL